MKRVFNILGSLLMVAGVALLVYVGVSYVRQQHPAASSNWSQAQKKQGRAIAARLTKGHKTQKIAIPKSLGKTKLPPAGSEPAVRIVIPKIGVDAPVVQTPPVNGVWNVANWAVGHLSTTPNPGAPGNSALAAHDDIEGEIFKRVDELHPGDVIKLYTQHAVYNYTVYNQQVVAITDTAVLNPTAKPVITLISCTPYWVDTQRLVIQAALSSRTAV
jgi:sortase A